MFVNTISIGEKEELHVRKTETSVTILEEEMVAWIDIYILHFAYFGHNILELDD